jgi:hypothetical protein
MTEVRKPMSQGELEILSAIGYLTMRWNYAEHCSRQILRQYVDDEHIDDPGHIRLSGRPAKWIEDELRERVLPIWREPGRTYLASLIDAYGAARVHRNQKVHGIWMTVDTGGSRPAQALLMNSMPVGGKTQAPDFIAHGDLTVLFEPFMLLGEFAQKVGVGFDKEGLRAHNRDGTYVIDPLPPLLVPLALPVLKPLAPDRPPKSS